MDGLTDDLTLAIERFDLEAYVEAMGGVREGRHEYLLDCPKCGKDHLAVNVRRKRWHCFTCERHGPVDSRTGRPRLLDGGGGIFALVQWMEGLAPARAARKIIETARPTNNEGDLPEAPAPKQVADEVRHPTGLPEGCIAVPHELPYMVRRRITLADATTFGLGWVPPGHTWVQNRLVFPVWNRGQCLYWQARACWDESEHVPRDPDDRFRKSLNPSRERDGRLFFGSSDVLWNLELASRFPRVCIVEGPTSGVRTGPDAVCTFGKQLSDAQVALLVAAGVRGVDFMWDGPTPGKSGQWGRPSVCSCHGNPGCAWPRMIHAASALAPHMDVRMVFLSEGDPGDYPREHLDWFRKQARPYEEGLNQLTF